MSTEGGCIMECRRTWALVTNDPGFKSPIRGVGSLSLSVHLQNGTNDYFTEQLGVQVK